MMRGMFSVYRSEGDILSPEFPVQSFVLQYLGKRMSMIVLLPAPAVKIDDILVKVNNSHRAASVLAPDSSPIHLRFFLKMGQTRPLFAKSKFN